MFFDLHADDGSIHRAERVVIATGPQGRPRIPSWVHEASAFLPSPPAVDAALLSAFGPHLLHTCQLGDLGAPEDRGTARRAAHGPLRALLRDKKVLIIGGGLTSGHLLVLAAEAGCEVTLLSRRQLAKRQFDLDAAWMTRARTALLNGYYSMPPPERAAFVARCRGGGTITPEVWVKLWEAVEMSCGKANVIQGDEVERAEFVEGNGWNLHLARSARVLDADIVVLATGCAADVASDPLFADLLAAFPIPMHNGLPELDHDLRWAPGVHVHVMGSKAALQLGPDALNLAGAMGGARRLWPVLRPVLEGIDGPEERKTMAGGKTKSGKSESMTRLMGGDGNLFAALCDESASEEEED
ncbi:hypothetical protein DFJ74DRAFT_684846 [Hyaloraphidium curvatum]|nr:hypothetical protein DFJ74DRAFT_684846 [Hyaloraphidium curvatum]